jgi:hypothetical protein
MSLLEDIMKTKSLGVTDLIKKEENLMKKQVILYM